MMTQRGALVTVAFAGDYGKPRPAVVIQSDAALRLESLAVLPITTVFVDKAEDLRIAVTPSEENGLRQTSYVMIDKIGAIERSRCGPVMGRLSDQDVSDVTRALAVFLGVV